MKKNKLNNDHLEKGNNICLWETYLSNVMVLVRKEKFATVVAENDIYQLYSTTVNGIPMFQPCALGLLCFILALPL